MIESVFFLDTLNQTLLRLLNKIPFYTCGSKRPCTIFSHLPSKAVDPGDPDTLEQGDDEQRQVSAEVVKQDEKVVARAVREDHGQKAADNADDACHKRT